MPLGMRLVQLAKLFHFLTQFPNDFGILTSLNVYGELSLSSPPCLIDDGMCLDALGPIRKSQCGKSFLVVIGGWGNCGNHGCPTVSSLGKNTGKIQRCPEQIMPISLRLTKFSFNSHVNVLSLYGMKLVPFARPF
jgi:hypothetical protein